MHMLELAYLVSFWGLSSSSSATYKAGHVHHLASPSVSTAAIETFGTKNYTQGKTINEPKIGPCKRD